MKIYIASDFHLKFDENKNEVERLKKVLDFLSLVEKEAGMLILNGDIFDLWFAWNSVIIKGYFPILRKFADIRENGCKIIFIAGNHDFWFGDFLAEQLDIKIYKDFFATEIDGKNIFVTHGDKYTSNDLRYKIFRALVRNKIVMEIFALIHPDFALKIGKHLSRSSRTNRTTKMKMKTREQGMIKHSNKILENYDIVIMGHSHLPKIIEFKNGIYANAGDWLVNNSYLKMVDGKLELCRFAQSEDLS